ncbi:hypothetical protein EPUS_01561 [Endocarpon pusillum Z07020]|uniref:Uncharacterized protein n=1 Tax=Endocarpon pusillum (strain Z07020 / HMAS-L-300199) TaxID=1263415 RepID=U1GUM0_ENDPU|nr:uncharacterized protein EPUS_01561 [Endocarpon pusillum Z07020]ERF75731.1 hypothetical protein EPUS_01561 [Endocarpon pusillum Z07020]
MNGRGLVPVALAVGLGIVNGYVVFNPAFQDLEAEKLRKQQAMIASDLGPNLVEVPVSRSEEQKGMDSTQQNPTSSSKATDMQPDNAQPQKPRWWQF